MSDVRPFRALRPLDALAGEVIAPPYDVLTPAEAKALAGDPRNFVRVTRAEVDLEEGADPHGDATYEKAAQNLAELEGKVGLIRSKAEESEAIVADICKDIKRLDRAKRNLQSTITALKRMHMLTSAVDQLRSVWNSLARSNRCRFG